MKKIASLIITTVMLCGVVSGYNQSGGQMSVTPHEVQSNLSESLQYLGIPTPVVSGESDTTSTAKLGDTITLFASGTASSTNIIATKFDLSNSSKAFDESQYFGAVCGSIMKLTNENISSSVANSALKIENYTVDSSLDSLRTYFYGNVLYTYEVNENYVRFTAIPHQDTANTIDLVVNDEALTLDVTPNIINDRTLVPVRGIFEHLGAQVEWESETSTAVMQSDTAEIRVTIGSDKAYVNGEEYTLDVPAQLVESRTLVPVRFIAEALGALVGWNSDTQTVVIALR